MGRHTIHVGAGAPARPAGHSPAGLNSPPTWRAVLVHTDEGVRIYVGRLEEKSRLCQPRHTVSGQTLTTEPIILFINKIHTVLYLQHPV